MSQSNIIAGTILLLFVVYITLKGELATYWSFIIPSTQPTSGGQQSSAAQTGQNIGGNLGTPLVDLGPFGTINPSFTYPTWPKSWNWLLGPNSGKTVLP